eukprot:131977-Chlamydomonas_euryale.AAC.5
MVRSWRPRLGDRSGGGGSGACAWLRCDAAPGSPFILSQCICICLYSQNRSPAGPDFAAPRMPLSSHRSCA